MITPFLKRTISFPILLLFLLTGSLAAQDSPTLPENPQPTDFAYFTVQEALSERTYPGIAVSVWKDGEMLWSQGFGYASIEDERRVSPSESLFRVGSISKAISAAGLSILVADGRLDLDAPIQEYVPYFPEKKWPITTRQVAGHVAGIRHYNGMEFWSNEQYNTVEEALSIFRDDTLLFRPGTQFGYSSYGWNLVSAAMEGASGQPFTEFMQENVFDPLGMRHTHPDDKSLKNLSRVSFYDDINQEIKLSPEVDLSNKWAGGGFISTSEDLIRFGSGMLNNKLVPEEITQMFWKSGQTEDGKATDYGIGWASGTDTGGHAWVGHAGGSVGGTSMLIIYPEEKLVVALVINQSSADARALAFQVAQHFHETDK